MAEIWGAALLVGGAVVSGVAASKKAKEDRKNAKEDRSAATEEDARYGAILSQFNAEQEDYFDQLGRKRKQRGLDEFRKFSTLGNFAPQYVNENTGIEVPNKPNIDAIIKEQTPEEEVTSGMGVGNEKPRKKGGGLLGKLDPLGSALRKKDPLAKALFGG